MSDRFRSELEEALGADAERVAVLLTMLADSGEVPAAARERLLCAARSPEQRFAPFFRRVADLFDISVPHAAEWLAKASDRASFRRTALPGVRLLDVLPGPGARDSETRLVWFEPGTRFPEHDHRGHEVTLVLAGGYGDSSGLHVVAGDRHEMEHGSAHAFRVDDDGPCIAASRLDGGVQFRSPILRLAARLSPKR